MDISPVLLAIAGIVLIAGGYIAGAKTEFGHRAWPLVFACGWIASALAALYGDYVDAPEIKLVALAVACFSIPAFMRSMYLFVINPVAHGLLERSMSRRRNKHQ